MNKLTQLRGSLVFTAGSLSWAVAQWFLVWLFARYAGGAAAVGEYALAMAVTTPIFILGHLGLRTIYLTLRRRHSWSTYIRVRFLGITISISVVLVYLLLNAVNSPWLWAALIFQKSVDAYLDLVYGRIQRQNRIFQIGMLGLAKTLGTILVSAIVILTTESITLAICGVSLVSTIVALLARKAALNIVDPAEADNTKGGYREILRAAVPVTITDSLASVSANLPTLFLGSIADESVAGVFTAAAYLFSVANIVGGILRNVLVTPLRITYETEGLGRLIHRTHKTAALLGLIGLFSVPIVILFGSPVLEFIYGEGFTYTYTELALLALGAVSILPTYLYSVLLNIVNYYDSQAWSLAGALSLGIGIGVIMAYSDTVPAIIVALTVALAVNWGRFVGVFCLTLLIPRKLKKTVL